MLVSLYTSRVVLNTLGVEDYGIYNVVGGIVSMFAFFNGAMSSATQRFLSFEIGRGDLVQLRKTFNITQTIHIGIAIIIFVLAETVGLWFVKTYLVIPTERMNAALWVYHFSVFSFMVSVIQVPYNATILAHERMNVYAYVSIIEVALKLLIVFMLTWITYDKLKLYGILQFVVVFIVAAIYRIYTRRNFDESKFELVKDKKLYKTMISYSGWNLFGSIAGVAKGQGVNVVLNMFFGPTVNAARGIAIQVQSAVQGFVSNFQMAVKPQIIKSFAAGDKDYMTSLIIKSSKFSFYLIFILSLPIILEIDQILKLWLKTVPEYTNIFTILILIVILIDSMSDSLMTGVQATGKIKLYQAVVGSLQIAILPISFIFLNYGYSPEITLFVNIVISIIALIVRLIFINKLIGFPISFFFKDVIFNNILVVALSFVIPYLIKMKMDANTLRIFTIAFISIIWSLSIVYIVGLNKSEKRSVVKLIKFMILNK